MKKSSVIFLKHIEESIDFVIEYSKGMSFSQFKKDIKIQDAILRRIEIIGEAVKKLPVEITLKYPDVRWSQIAGMRDKLIHQYFGVDLEIVWNVVREEIPELKTRIKKILEEEKNE
jgi:uncharacterized protein with HEPN domain